MEAERFRFDVYGCFEVVFERIDGRWQILQLEPDGKRRLLTDVSPPLDVTSPDTMSNWLETCFHEHGGPGMHIRQLL